MILIPWSKGYIFFSHAVIKEWKARHVWNVADQTYQLQRKFFFVADDFRRPTYRLRWKASETSNAFNSELRTWHHQYTFHFQDFQVFMIFLLPHGTNNNGGISVRLMFHAWWITSQRPVSGCLFPRPCNFTNNLVE